MPINWTVSHPERLVMLRTEGALDYGDVQASLAGVLAEGAQPYRKLLDAREGYTIMQDHEIAAYGAALKYQARVDNFGPYAIVVGSDEGHAHDPILSRLLLLRTRPIRMFFSIDEAHDWLKSQPVPGEYASL
jgi:hypothetical protein